MVDDLKMERTRPRELDQVETSTQSSRVKVDLVEEVTLTEDLPIRRMSFETFSLKLIKGGQD
jgi:hypothetical protein